MIKFFRKIRQKLLVENRFNKYLLYAIGEIILVVIGILIALQINNWNEKSKIEANAKILSKELYQEYKKVGKTFKFAHKGINVYTNYLEDIINNWSNLNKSLIDSLDKNSFVTVKLSALFYLTSYSQFNDLEIPIYQKSISEGTINLMEPKFISALTYSYDINKRLNEMITQEYEMGKAINLHIANNYNSILINFKEVNNNIDTATLNKLLAAFGKDGTLKYLIKSRLNLANTRKMLLELSFKIIEKNLVKYKHLNYD